MREVDRIILDLQIAEGTPADLLDELFWASLARGLGTGTASWGRLFADCRGWSKGGGDASKEDEDRITDAQAAAMIRSLLGVDPEG